MPMVWMGDWTAVNRDTVWSQCYRFFENQFFSHLKLQNVFLYYFTRLFPAELRAEERWVTKTLSPLLKILNSTNEARVGLFLETKDGKRNDLELNKAWVHLLCSVESSGKRFFKQLSLNKERHLLEIYDITDYGRRIYATQMFAKDSSLLSVRYDASNIWCNLETDSPCTVFINCSSNDWWKWYWNLCPWTFSLRACSWCVTIRI